MKRVMILACLAMAVVGCSKAKQVFVKDMPIEDQMSVHEDYRDRSAWTRQVIEDIGEGGSIDRDTKVKIVDVNMAYGGAVLVKTPNNKTRIKYDLDIERPLTKQKIDARLDEIFWYEDPVLRQVAYIRKWGKKTARAIAAHEIIIGMPAEAAIESWGHPADVNVNEIGGKKNEQWIYPDAKQKRNKYIYVIDGKVTKVED